MNQIAQLGHRTRKDGLLSHLAVRLLESVSGVIQMLTQDRLKKYVHYDPASGIFTWARNFTTGRYRRRKGWDATIEHGKKYRGVCLLGEKYYAHRLAFLYMEGAIPPDQVDHIDHDRSNNAWENLRHSDNQTNQCNLPLRKCNTSGHHGVAKRYGAWGAVIAVNGKHHYLGVYDRKEDAIKARKAAEVKYGFHENHGKVAI